MSSHNQNENTAASPNFVSIVLILTFVITLGIMSFGNFPTSIVEAENEASVAVAELAADVPLPTETDIPPTATIEPRPTAPDLRWLAAGRANKNSPALFDLAPLVRGGHFRTRRWKAGIIGSKGMLEYCACGDRRAFIRQRFVAR